MAKWKLHLSTTEPNNDVGLIKINQDDENSQTFEAEINEFGQLKDFSNREVYFNAKIGPYKVRDKVPPESIYYDSNRVSYTLIAPFLQKVGEFEAWFSFKNTDDELDEFSTAFFSYRVVPGVTKDIKEGNYFWDLEELLRYFKQHKHLITEVIENKDFSGLIDQLVQINDRTSNLDNFSTASKTEAEQGVAPNKLMTPERVKQQTDARIATTDEAKSGSDEKKLMTPERVKQQTDSRLASMEEAKLGANANKLMTPETTKAFYDANTITKHYPIADLAQCKWGDVYITRTGDVVSMNAAVGTLDDAIAANNAIFTPITFPEGFRPTTDTGVVNYVPAMFETYFGSVSTGGSLKLKVAMDGSHGHNITGTWTTADEFPR
mgnify:CR=1 FL=1